MIQVRVAGVALDPTGQHVILLKPLDEIPGEGLILPIWIGQMEATSILVAVALPLVALSIVLDLDGNPQPVVARTDTSEMAVTIGADGFSYTRPADAPEDLPSWKQGEYKLGHQL